MKNLILIVIIFVGLNLQAQVNQILPTNIYNGLIDNPSSPSLSNPFATFADLPTGGTTSVTVTPPLTVTSGSAIAMPVASATASGYLSAADWNTFNSHSSGVFTGFLGTTCSVNFGANLTYYGDLTASGSRFDVQPTHHSISFIAGSSITAIQLSLAAATIANTSTLTANFYLTDITTSTDYFICAASPSMLTAVSSTYIINVTGLSIPISQSHTYQFKVTTPNWTSATGGTSWVPNLSFVLAFN